MMQAATILRPTLAGLLLLTSAAQGREPELTLRGLPAACKPVYAATVDGLTLHSQPSLDSPRRQLDYERGWALPYEAGETLARVGRSGLFSSFEEYPLSQCQPALPGKQHLKMGEPVKLLFSLGRDLHYVEVRNRRCQLEMDIDRAELHVVKRNEAEFWLQVRFGDGSPAGWLLQDGSQSRLAGLECPAGS